MIKMKKPGGGISHDQLEEVLGRTPSKRDYSQERLLTLDDLV